MNFVDSAAEVIGVALIALGHSINSDDPDDLEDARQLLLTGASVRLDHQR